MNDRVFWTLVRATSNGCWEFLGTTNRQGYGTVYIGWDREARRSRYQLAHRHAWELVNGPIPADLGVLHRCDNPPCVNPAHLFVGTHADNMRDMAAKGRGANMPTPGEANHFHRLTAVEVQEIRERYSFRRVTTKMLAAEYGVHPDTVHKLLRRTTWKESPSVQ